MDYTTTLSKLVDLICYNLLDNHYHFIFKQLIDKGIEKFMSKLASGYTQYFNHEYNHSGVLFQGPFQAHPILNDNKLCWLSGYVNCNYEIHKLGKAEDWRFSSYLDYLKQRDGKLINKQPILELFNNIESYKEHCQKVIQEAQGKEKTRKMLLE